MRQWHDMLRRVLDEGEEHLDRTGVGTLSVFGHQATFDMLDMFPIVTTKRIPFRWCAEELFWMLRGSTDEDELRAQGVDIWREWSDEAHTRPHARGPGDLGPVYGFQIRRWGARYLPTLLRNALYPIGGDLQGRDVGYDQLAALVIRLRNDPFSRRHIVTLWNPEDVTKVDVPPCPCFFQVKVHPDLTMSMHLYQRSADAFLGVPFDIAEFALLLEMLAKVFGTSPRKLVVSYGDLHLYKNHLDAARQAMSREFKPNPMLFVHKNRKTDQSDLSMLTDIGWEDLQLLDYDPWPKIEAQVAV